MQDLDKPRVLLTGGTSGLGRAIVGELSLSEFETWVIGRNKYRLSQLEGPWVRGIAGDATDERLINKVVGELKPQIMILNAGATPVMGSLEEQTWDSFNAVWNTDVKAGLYGIQAALKVPMPPGSRVVVITSGAAMVGAPLSGSYAGAKRMLWFMVQYANDIAKKKGLGISFQTLLPMQMISSTHLAQTIASAYATPKGLTVEEYIEERYGQPLSAASYAKHVHHFLTGPQYQQGVAYGIHQDTGIQSVNPYPSS
jgi:NAD(P)-dependent dehydrogenase (short-subunit alcohol dehydrogenase family)